MKNLFFICFALLMAIPFTAEAQKGKIRGKVIEEATGEPLMFTNVYIKDTDPVIGSQTDLDGNYEIAIDPGTYTLVVTYVGLADANITDIVVKADEISVIDVSMKEAGLELEEVIVKADRIENNEVALLAIQRQSINVQDAISSQEMSRFGASNAAESMKRVTGASVVGGQYIIVRGLGDRYSSAQLNGLLLPSTDPYRNATQLDLIPSNLLDNMIATKTFTPNQPGNTTGGNINIKTKSFPERMTLAANVSMSFNTLSSFQNNFQSYNGGANDGLGYDDGSRDVPSILRDPEVLDIIPVSATFGSVSRDIRGNEALTQKFDQAARSLNTDYEAFNDQSFTDHSVSLSFGNQYNLFNNPLGVLVAANYRKSFDFYENGDVQNWVYSTSSDNLRNEFLFTENRSVESPTLGGMVNLAYKFGGSNKISFNTIYNHTSDKSYIYNQGIDTRKISSNDTIQSRNLRFREREIQSYQLLGEHAIGKNGIRLEWSAGMTNSSQNEPDYRIFENTFIVSDSEPFETRYGLDEAEIRVPSHLWFGLEDEQISGKVDLTIPFWQSKSKANKIQVGGFFADKDRTFGAEFWEFDIGSPPSLADRYLGSPNDFVGQDQIGIVSFRDGSTPPRANIGYYPEQNESNRIKNSYNGTETITAGYAMSTFDLNKWKIIVGARVENTDISVASLDTSFDEGNIKQTDILPSANLIYALTDNMNLRASFSQTLARPNMRELAPFTSFDSNAGFRITGNPELERTLIQNYDIRWELFPASGEVFSVSGYYKNFENPILKAFDLALANNAITFENVDQAVVYGVEFEARKRLGFIADALSDFRLITNVSLIHSEVDIPDDEIEEIERLGSDKGTTRPFQGQSPYLVNVALNYNNSSNGWDATLAYNVFGERLTLNSRSANPDWYQRPIPQLDLSVSKQITPAFRAKFSAQNLLDKPYKESIEQNGQEYLIRRFDRGITFGLSLSYNFTPRDSE